MKLHGIGYIQKCRISKCAGSRFREESCDLVDSRPNIVVKAFCGKNSSYSVTFRRRILTALWPRASFEHRMHYCLELAYTTVQVRYVVLSTAAISPVMCLLCQCSKNTIVYTEHFTIEHIIGRTRIALKAVSTKECIVHRCIRTPNIVLSVRR